MKLSHHLQACKQSKDHEMSANVLPLLMALQHSPPSTTAACGAGLCFIP